MNKIIPYGKQYIEKRDIVAVTEALKNDKVTTGPYVKKFENKISQFVKSKYSTVCSSGTAALYLAFKSSRARPVQYHQSLIRASSARLARVDG